MALVVYYCDILMKTDKKGFETTYRQINRFIVDWLSIGSVIDLLLFKYKEIWF